MKKIIFILTFLVMSTGASAGEVSLGLIGMASVDGRNEIFNKSSPVVMSYDHGNKLVVGIDAAFDGSIVDARIGYKIGKGVVSIGLGAVSGIANSATVGGYDYQATDASLSFTFIEYKRDEFIGRIGRRLGDVMQVGIEHDSSRNPISYTTRNRSTDAVFISIGLRVPLRK